MPDCIDPDYETAHYPRWRYHRTKAAVIVANVEQDQALGTEWANTPAAFYAPVMPTTTQEPIEPTVEQAPITRKRRKGEGDGRG